MALEDSDNQTSQDWTGSCELHDMAVALTEGVVMSRSRHTFCVENYDDDEILMTMEYKHYLEKWNGDDWEEVGEDTKPDAPGGENGSFTVPVAQSYSHEDIEDDKHWSNTRSVIDSDGESGDRYRLSCYTEVNPVAPVDGRSIEARVDQREFTV